MRRAYSRGLVAAAAASALALSACGGNMTTAAARAAAARPAAASVTIGFMGAQTGPNAQLGINISNGAELAIEQYNATSPASPSQADQVRHPGRPDAGHEPGQEGGHPTRSSRSSARRSPVSRRRPTRSSRRPASRTSRRRPPTPRWPRTAGSSGTACWPTTACRARRRRLHRQDAEGQDRGRHRRPERVRQGSGRRGPQAAGDRRRQGRGQRRDRPGRVDASPRRSTRSSRPTPDVVFFGGYYSAAGKLVKQLRDGGVRASSCPVTARSTQSSSRAAVPPPRARC